MPRGRKKTKIQPVLDDRRPNVTIKAFIGLAIILIITGLLFALFTRHEIPLNTSSSREVLGEQSLAEQRIVIGGEVNSIFDDKVFSIGGEDFVDDQELLVISVQEISGVQGRENKALASGDLVTIEGEAISFDEQSVRERTGITLSPVLLRDFADQRVIIADKIFVTGRKPQPSIPVIPDPVTEISSIITYPEQPFLAHRAVEIISAQVVEPITDTVFWMGTSDSQRILAKTDDKNDLTHDQQISVSGTIEIIPEPVALLNTWKLPEEQYSLARQEKIYIKINSIGSVVESPFNSFIPFQ